MFAFLDTPFDRDYPVYTRANAGEILPDPVTPLAWSVIGPGFEEGFRISFCDDFSLLPRPGHETPFKLVGRMAGRFHLNLTAMRLAGDRLPGTSAHVVDLQYFGDAAATGLPEHQSHADDRRFRLKAPPSMGRTLAGIGRRVDRDRAMIDELTHDLDAMDPSAGDDELVRMLRRVAAAFGVALGTHVTARALTSPILEQAVNALGRAGIASEDALRYVASIPDLESARPSRALAEIARTIPADSDLARLVGQGSLDTIGASDIDGAADLHRRLVGFVDEFGHRGIGEFDPTNAAWGQRPDDVVILLGHLRATPPPTVEAPDVDPGRVARPLVAAARSAMARAERTKDTCMRSTNLLRRLLFDLGDRLGSQLTVGQFHMCTLGELEARANGAGLPLVDELDRRAREFDAAASIVVGEWSDGGLRTVDATDAPAPCDADGRIEGIAGSPGVTEGRARIVTDPYQDFDEGEVLVASMTDTAWTPLFLVAGAVITDVGGVLSHATIVARDLGIPAVVNTKVATTTLRDGDLVRVDGSTGEITVVERA
ncbi:PEP-utilizing enzyme [Actinospongicola halichondriae]|uniref:PEP-utilizing enzyme n=1 Tax=Actinospongicola halichondriae TaxID=3236844 RepID=UPI003D55F517